MPLINFGSVLNFAEEIENQGEAFFSAAAANPACAAHRELFEQLAANAGKHKKIVQRTRRENVTEMILEGIEGFTRAPYQEASGGADTMSVDDALAGARRLEERCLRYYQDAAGKLKALSEVARALKQLAKKHNAQLNQLGER
jgi:rubrerythrin